MILDVQNLTKKFGGFTAVDNISFGIKEGEIVGLLGPNGAGKTTTISMIMSVLAPTRGKIEIFGKDLQRHREEVLRSMNFSSAYTKAPWRMKVWEHLYIFARLYEIDQIKEKINSLIDTFELIEYKDEMIGG